MASAQIPARVVERAGEQGNDADRLVHGELLLQLEPRAQRLPLDVRHHVIQRAIRVDAVAVGECRTESRGGVSAQWTAAGVIGGKDALRLRPLPDFRHSPYISVMRRRRALESPEVRVPSFCPSRDLLIVRIWSTATSA